MTETTTAWYADKNDPPEFAKAVLAWLQEAGVDPAFVASVRQDGEESYLIDRFKTRHGRPYFDHELKTAARQRDRVTITTPPPPRP